MSETGCTHPETDVVDLDPEQTYASAKRLWCSVCGSLYESDNMSTGHWTAPSGLLLPGWTCAVPTCRAFNGEAKGVITECRACGAPRKPKEQDDENS